MNRNARLAKYTSREKRGIEIGPWCHPITPKRGGFDCLVLDVFDTVTLRQRAAADTGIPDDLAAGIEDVDLVGSSCDIAALVAARAALGTFDYIVSSHNFEHLPDPVRFLHGCAQVLKTNGILTMAIPDRRACFDYFRPRSTLAEMLAAYFEKRERPTQAQIFERWSLHARHMDTQGNEAISFPRGVDPAQVVPFDSLEDAFAMWQTFAAAPDTAYRDTHCWVLTPAAFEHILLDLARLGLTPLSLLEVEEAGSEFFVHLRKEDPAAGTDSAACLTKRRQLMLQMLAEDGASCPAQPIGAKQHALRRWLGRLKKTRQ